jgi:hypothetical protein
MNDLQGKHRTGHAPRFFACSPTLSLCERFVVA